MKPRAASCAATSEPAGLDARYSPGLVASVALLALLAALFSAWPMWRALFELEISSDEPRNAYLVDILSGGRALYPDPASLITNNYPPLSFYVVGGLSAVSVDPVYVGRILSLLSVLATAVAVSACVRQLGGSKLAAIIAALWFVATMVRFFHGYVGVNDPHLPALSVTVPGMAWLLHRRSRKQAPEPAILVMAVAGFYKHSLIATPVAALLWLAMQDWRTGLRAALYGAAFAVAGLALCTATYGIPFLHQLLFYPRAHSIWWAFGNLGQLQFIAPALFIWAIWAWSERGRGAAGFTALYIGAGLLAYFLQKLGSAIGVNAQFELVAATAIGLGLALSRIMVTPFGHRWGADLTRVAIVGIVVARLLLSNHVEPYLVVASPAYRRLFADHAAVTAKEVERVRAIAGPLNCVLISVCRWAGHDFVYDPDADRHRLAAGRITPAQVSDKLRLAGIRTVEIDRRVHADTLQRKFFWWMR
jgi:hypothetical protein